MFDKFENKHLNERIFAMNERREGILEILKKEKSLSVSKLSKLFFVSEMTIRRDLKDMEKDGYLKRYHGGAIIDSGAILPINIRKLNHLDNREAIMQSAKKHLGNSMSVFIDSSSTCMYIIPAIAEFSDITIITNSVQSVLLAQRYHINSILAGGSYYEHDMCTVGSRAEEFLKEINADTAFFSAQGISEDGIISDNDEKQTAIRKIMMKNSAKKIFFFDKSKLDSKHLYTLCKADDADEIIVID